MYMTSLPGFAPSAYMYSSALVDLLIQSGVAFLNPLISTERPLLGRHFAEREDRPTSCRTLPLAQSLVLLLEQNFVLELASRNRLRCESRDH